MPVEKGRPPVTHDPTPLGRHGNEVNRLRARRMGIDTLQEPVIYMRRDCAACRSEGFEAQARIRVRLGDREVIATLNVVLDDRLEHGDAGLSEAAWRRLDASERADLGIGHADPLPSLARVRAKLFGEELDAAGYGAIVEDVAAGRYSDIELAAFVSACAGDRMTTAEVIALSQAMVASGERLSWGGARVLDKHCVGGLPGNRTTLVVVPIIAATGRLIPKTSSRAITSPAGTADAMETLAPVDLDLRAMRSVVEREGGCIVWGGRLGLSPADDTFIRVERPLDIDASGQLVASVLSKKAAAGATDVLIDVPVGPTAKIRTAHAFLALKARMTAAGDGLGLRVSCLRTDGSQPIGRGIGPSLEARDALAVLRNAPDAPADLRERSLVVAAALLELDPGVGAGNGRALAERVLTGGAAARKLDAIRAAQGGARDLRDAPHRRAVEAPHQGRVATIDNRRLARIAKLAGAPRAVTAGLDLHVRIGDPVATGQPLFTLHAETPGELAYALAYVASGNAVALEEGS